MLVFLAFWDLEMKMKRREGLHCWIPWLFMSVTGLPMCIMIIGLGLWTSPVFEKAVGLVILKLARL